MASQLEPRRGGRRSGMMQPRSIPSAFDNLFKEFEDFFSGSGSMLSPSGEASMSLAVEARETENSYIISVDLPGVKKENIDVDISGDLLTIRGERHDEYQKTEGRSVYSERRYGGFERSFTLPSDTDPSHVEATFDNGVLHLMVPRSSVSKRHKISVKEGGGFVEKIKKVVGLDKDKEEKKKGDETKAS